ncbi:MAG TPA: hypothetical protein VMU95_35825, partial [Trebonia sp.]|nr:hypothetical protein [Trebonia sp.]
MPVSERALPRLGSVARVATVPLAAAGLAALLLTGCGSASAKPDAGASPGSSASGSAAAGGMAGMDMTPSPAATGSGASAGGISAVPMQVLGTATWQGMKITADAMTPVPFLIYNGTSMQEV